MAKDNVKNEYGLTEKEEAYCHYFVGECKGVSYQAYIKAFSPKSRPNTIHQNASRLLKKDKIRARINMLREKKEETAIATIEEIQAILTQMARGETEEEVIVIEGTGDGKSQARTKLKKINAKDRTNAMNTLLKSQGAFLPETQVNIAPVVVMGDEKLED